MLRAIFFGHSAVSSSSQSELCIAATLTDETGEDGAQGPIADARLSGTIEHEATFPGVGLTASWADA